MPPNGITHCHVSIFKPKNGKRLLEIRTIFGRTNQHLFKLAIESIREPFANKYSFESWREKCAHMAVGEIAYILDTKRQRVHEVNDKRMEENGNFLFPNG